MKRLKIKNEIKIKLQNQCQECQRINQKENTEETWNKAKSALIKPMKCNRIYRRGQKRLHEQWDLEKGLNKGIKQIKLNMAQTRQQEMKKAKIYSHIYQQVKKEV